MTEKKEKKENPALEFDEGVKMCFLVKGEPAIQRTYGRKDLIKENRQIVMRCMFPKEKIKIGRISLSEDEIKKIEENPAYFKQRINELRLLQKK